MWYIRYQTVVRHWKCPLIAQQIDVAAQEYQHALQRAGYEHKLKFEKSVLNTSTQQKSKNHMVQSHPTPASAKNVSTNIGRKFLNLMDTHFPKDNKLHKIFNCKNQLQLYGQHDQYNKCAQQVNPKNR